MSIGNLKDQGNKGNNFPYQLRNLQLLGDINQGIIDLNDAVVPGSAGAMAIDAFGRQRVSETFTLGDYKNLYDLDPNMINELTGGAGISFVPSRTCAELSVSSAGESAIRQTKFYHPYMPGKSQLIYATFNMYAAVNGVEKSVGYYDDTDGIFFKQDFSGLYFIIRSNVVDAEIAPQASWNVDKCNGTGPSGFNLDITKTQILFIDFQWLGVGRVRMGFVHEGGHVIAHEFQHDNILPQVYMLNPNLPVRYEIRSTGLGSAKLDQICATVLSEGGYIESGQDWSALVPTLVSIVAGATKPILAIKLSNTFKSFSNRMIVRLDSYNLFSTKEALSYELIKLASEADISAGTWTPRSPDSGVEFGDTLTLLVSGDVVASGYVPASASGKEGIAANSNPSSAKKNYIVQDYSSSSSEVYVLVATNLGTNTTNVGASMQWREIY